MWFTQAAASRLNGVTGLNASIEEFPAASLLGTFVVPTPNGPQSGDDVAALQLNTFFAPAGGYLDGRSEGGLRGHIAREYRAEANLGGGLSHLITGEPGSPLQPATLSCTSSWRAFT